MTVDFHERQQEFLHKQHEKREKYRSEEGKEFSFKPKINATSGVIIEADPERCNENSEQKYDRLYNKDVRKANENRELMEEELYSKYTYQPKINHLSRLMVADRAPTDILNLTQISKSTLTHPIHQEYEQKHRKECTFKPKINNNYSNVRSEYTNKDILKAKLQEKAMQRRQVEEQKRMDQEYEELKDCTFKPVINNDQYQAHDQVVVVRGLSRYMELQELALKKTQDQIDREIKGKNLNYLFYSFWTRE
jgi:hypothetical protein